MLFKYYKTSPCFSADELTARNYVYFFKTSFKKVIFFGLLRVPMMTLPRQPVFFISFDCSLFFLFSVNNSEYVEVHAHQLSSTMHENYERYNTITGTTYMYMVKFL